MFSIAKKEFLDMTKSFKSIFVIGVFVLTSYFMSNFVSNNLVELDAGANDYVSATRLLVLLFGFLFVLMLSHDVLSREISTKTIRFLITKTSRVNIIVGKFIGVSMFWFFSLGISMGIISIVAGQLFWLIFLQLYFFLIYAIGLCLLISTLSKTPNISMIMGLAVSFIFPIIGFWSLFSEKKLASIFKYLFPYNYQLGETASLIVPLIIGLFFIVITMSIFKREDY